MTTNYSALHSKQCADTLMLVENLSVQHGENILCKDLNFLLSRGRCICLLGPNGCGKTSLISVLAGMGGKVQYQAAKFSGEISFFSKGDGDFFEGHCAWLPQQLPCVDGISVEGFLRLWAKSVPHDLNLFPDKDIFGVSSLRDRSLMGLSGGEWKRVQLHKLFLPKKNIVLLDEPNNSLDLKYISALGAKIKSYCDEGNGVLLSSHDLSFAFSVADFFLYFAESGDFFAEPKKSVNAMKNKCVFISRTELQENFLKKNIFSVPVSWHNSKNENLVSRGISVPLVHY